MTGTGSKTELVDTANQTPRLSPFWGAVSQTPRSALHSLSPASPRLTTPSSPVPGPGHLTPLSPTPSVGTFAEEGSRPSVARRQSARHLGSLTLCSAATLSHHLDIKNCTGDTEAPTQYSDQTLKQSQFVTMSIVLGGSPSPSTVGEGGAQTPAWGRDPHLLEKAAWKSPARQESDVAGCPLAEHMRLQSVRS